MIRQMLSSTRKPGPGSRFTARRQCAPLESASTALCGCALSPREIRESPRPATCCAKQAPTQGQSSVVPAAHDEPVSQVRNAAPASPWSFALAKRCSRNSTIAWIATRDKLASLRIRVGRVRASAGQRVSELSRELAHHLGRLEATAMEGQVAELLSQPSQPGAQRENAPDLEALVNENLGRWLRSLEQLYAKASDDIRAELALHLGELEPELAASCKVDFVPAFDGVAGPRLSGWSLPAIEEPTRAATGLFSRFLRVTIKPLAKAASLLASRWGLRQAGPWIESAVAAVLDRLMDTEDAPVVEDAVHALVASLAALRRALEVDLARGTDEMRKTIEGHLRDSVDARIYLLDDKVRQWRRERETAGPAAMASRDLTRRKLAQLDETLARLEGEV